jgi:hypothetical protein
MRFSWNALVQRMATPVNGTSLAAFRIAVGIIIALEALALVQPNPAAISTGLTPLQTYYAAPDITFHFPYAGFEWLPLLPAAWMNVLVFVLAGSAVCVAVGFCYRAAVVTMFLSWAYFFLVESTRTYWQSHYYLEFLAVFLLMWMPAARRWSIDARLRRRRDEPLTVPFWTLAVLRGQLVIAYFYAGVAKINADWLLDAVPVRWFLAEPHVTRPFEPFLSGTLLEWFRNILHSPAFAYFISYTGLVFDLAIGFLLLARRTRTMGLVLMLCFHGTNHLLIFDDISWFPLLGLTTATIFLNPDWPERLLHRFRRSTPQPAKRRKTAPTTPAQPARIALSPFTVPLVLAWLVWQSLMPLRHFAIPGDARFTYEGLSFSWRLKADVHHAHGAKLYVRDPQMFSMDASGRAAVDWAEWKGEQRLYRRVEPGDLDWSALPELVVLVEPLTGERVVYNALSGRDTARSEAESRERVRALWAERFGRQPQHVRQTLPLPQVLDRIAQALRAGRHNQEADHLNAIARKMDAAPAQVLSQPRAEAFPTLRLLDARDQTGYVFAFLRLMEPFAFEARPAGNTAFFDIEDSLLHAEGNPRALNTQRWRAAGATDAQPQPMQLFLGSLAIDERQMMPRAWLVVEASDPTKTPAIRWNSLRDLTPSKYIHTSNQAFYLRRYAQRVADLWEAEYGRRPAVHAWTAASLNARPHQALVDPEADLASVNVRWMRHNPWVYDLQTPRIPRNAVTSRPLYSWASGEPFAGDLSPPP